MLPFHSLRRLATLAVLVAAPISLHAQGRSVAGTYTTTINSPQGPIKAVITVTGDKGTLGGTLAADGFPSMPITKVTPSDAGVAIQVDTPDGGVSVDMKFVDASKVQGTLNYQGMPLPIEGTFAPAGGLASAVGTYNMLTSQPLMGAAQFDVQCAVTKNAAGVYGGTCGNSENGEVPIGTVSIAGNVVTIAGDTPAGPYKLVMTITGTAAEGTISVGSETAKMKGTFTAK